MSEQLQKQIKRRRNREASTEAECVEVSGQAAVSCDEAEVCLKGIDEVLDHSPTLEESYLAAWAALDEDFSTKSAA